ncbi:spherulation-specific family 4 protein [Sphaerisporangium fuscum]|uniref:spherulation-specific family 4 protein n=1 Tax=Sphaerisporangium fuscum TaxID=2835868 RepID=UPI001BDD075B|nr:spherulation-specific family 4 protein [Sphaerisporangium fuscum]
MPSASLRRSARAAALAPLVASLLTLSPAPAQAAGATLGQQVAVPAYFYPGGQTATYWTQLTSAGTKPAVAVVNVLNGPTSTSNPDYAAAIASAHAAGVKIIGYVDTGYFGTTGKTTRLDSTSADDWRTQIQIDVDNWYAFYGSNIDGIFFDQAQNACGPAGGGDAWVDLYREAGAYVKKYHPGAITIDNPGAPPAACYQDAADILVTFESNYDTYMNPPAELAPPAWQAAYDPQRIWNLVYKVPDQTALNAVIAKSKANNAGYVYVTGDDLDNPWDSLPSYMSSEITAAQGSGGATPAAPAAPAASLVKATSLRLTWTSAAYPDVVGYDVYQGSTKIGTEANHTPNATVFDVEGLSPSTAYTFSLRARDKAGNTSPAGTPVSVTTAPRNAHAPTTPGTPVASNVGPTSVRLTWTASNDADSGDYVAYYDILKDGVRVLSVPGTVTTAYFGGLSSAHTYSFTVKARDTTDNFSAASGAVSVTTTNPAPIANAQATLGTNTATYSAQFNMPWGSHHVFIDTDNNPATGYTVPLGAGVGADYMIEDNALYRSTGTSWGWTAVSGVSPLISKAGGLYQWSVPTSAFTGAGTTHGVIFNGSGDVPDAYSNKITVTKS